MTHLLPTPTWDHRDRHPSAAYGATEIETRGENVANTVPSTFSVPTLVFYDNSIGNIER